MGGEEQIKCCTKCHTEKPINDYRISKNGKYGVGSVCKLCMNAADRQRRKDGCTKHREISKKYYQKNKEDLLKKNKQYRIDNIETIKLYEKEYRENNQEKRYEYGKMWREVNSEKIKIDKIEYNKKNRGKINKRNNNNRKKYEKENPHVVIWRSTLRSVLKRLNQTKNGKTHDILKYTPQDLKTHLESLFTDGMSWENYGDWHVDHIKSVSSFDEQTSPHIVNALSNLQPLWATTREINGIIYEGNLNKSNN